LCCQSCAANYSPARRHWRRGFLYFGVLVYLTLAANTVGVLVILPAILSIGGCY
jgi:hypothetical protein